MAAIKNRIFRAQRIKRAIQMYKKACNEMYKVGLFSGETTSYQVLEDELDALAKIFNLKIQRIKEFDYVDGAIFIDGFKIYAYRYSEKHKSELGYSDKKLQQQLKEIFFDIGDKKKAFEKMREIEKQKCEEDYNREKYSWSNKFKTLQEFEKHINRKLNKTYEQITNEYLAYKSSWEVSNDNTEMEDYYFPLTFKQWYKVNY